MRVLVCVLGVMTVFAVACSDSDSSDIAATTSAVTSTTAAATDSTLPPAATTTAPASSTAPTTSTTNQDALACGAYLRFTGRVTSDMALIPAVEQFFDEAARSVDQMAGYVDADTAKLFGRYGDNLEGVRTFLTDYGRFEHPADAWIPLSTEEARSDLLPLLDELDFGTTEQAVWAWAAETCGRSVADCSWGALLQVLAFPPSDDLYPLIDPQSCD